MNKIFQSKLLFLFNTLLISFLSQGQAQIYLNDVFYDRMFRSVIVSNSGIRDTTLSNLKKRKLNLYQKTKIGIEAIPSFRGFPAFGFVSSAPVVKRINFDFGFMVYKRPFEDIPNTDNFAWTGSFGLSFYSKLAKIYTGGMFRWGNAPTYVVRNDSLIWTENVRSEVNPYLYYELPISKFSLATNVMPSFDYKTLAKLGLYAMLRFKAIKQMAYGDRMQTPVGFDYDGGYEIRYIFKDPMAPNAKIKNERLNESAFMKLRVGNAFRVNSLRGETFEDKLNEANNQYGIFEIGYYWMGGICIHESNGVGWRVGVDYGTNNFRVIATYQRNYVLPVAFANQIDQGNLYISIKMGF